MRRAVLILPVLALHALAESSTELHAVFPESNPMAGWVETRPLTERELEACRAMDSSVLQGQLRVWVDVEAEVPAVLGRVELEERRLMFRPRYPWRSGIRYRAEWSPPGSEPVPFSFQAPRADTAGRTSVTRIHPEAEFVPANLLRFYVEFSGPMDDEQSLAGMRLLDEAGVEIDGAFVETPPLWDRAQRRVTLICHPGRIKRGLQMNRDLGAPLDSIARVTLLVPAELLDIHGQPLAGPASREFSVVAPDRSSPLPSSWEWLAPQPGTRDPLRVSFGEHLDAILVERMLSVRGRGGKAVAGVGTARPDGSAWSFLPAHSWPDEPLSLRIDARLEDLAGNRIDAPFEQSPTDALREKPSEVELCLAGCP